MSGTGNLLVFIQLLQDLFYLQHTFRQTLPLSFYRFGVHNLKKYKSADRDFCLTSVFQILYLLIQNWMCVF